MCRKIVSRNFKDPRYKKWRQQIYERDNYKCQWPGCRHKKYLNAHHIEPFFLYEKLRFSVSNGKTLCEKCHMKTDTFGVKALLKFNL